MVEKRKRIFNSYYTFDKMNKTYALEYYNGTQWIGCGTWSSAELAWASLGNDNYNYRVIDVDNNVIYPSV